MSTAFAHITDVSALAEAIAQRCEQARQRGGRWEACCPAHDDTTPSLSIAAGTQTGSVVLGVMLAAPAGGCGGAGAHAGRLVCVAPGE